MKDIGTRARIHAQTSIGLVAVATAGCSYALVSPPSRLVNIESAHTVAPGETMVGARAAAYAGLFDPAVQMGSAGVRRGVKDGMELSAEGTWAHVMYKDFPDIDRNIFAGRVGAKLANRDGWAALTAGAGGGLSPAAGRFAAIDGGAILSYTNCYAIPFANFSMFGSRPFGTKRVYFRTTDVTLEQTDQAGFTYGYIFGVGLEILMGPRRCEQGLTPPRVQLGLAATTMIRSARSRFNDSQLGDNPASQGDGYSAIGLAVGLEFPF